MLDFFAKRTDILKYTDLIVFKSVEQKQCSWRYQDMAGQGAPLGSDGDSSVPRKVPEKKAPAKATARKSTKGTQGAWI
jgi:hypothetical protein